MANFNDSVIKEFHDRHGEVSGPFAGMKLLLLHVTGAKSGTRYTYPLAYTMDGPNYVIAASKGGAPTNPDWYFNLKAHPSVIIEVGASRLPVTARLTDGSERDRLYEAHAAAYPTFNDYAAKTTRTIPVFVLEPAASSHLS